jgi:pimeloyl-ACP methyl ester carboxylesterase
MDHPAGAFADINGLRLYYEVHGRGRPVVLLHGGVLTIDFMFGAMLPTLAAAHKVIAVELQGHGRTADTDRAMSFDQLSDDVAGLLAHLSGSRRPTSSGSASAGWSGGRS